MAQTAQVHRNLGDLYKARSGSDELGHAAEAEHDLERAEACSDRQSEHRAEGMEAEAAQGAVTDSWTQRTQRNVRPSALHSP